MRRTTTALLGAALAVAVTTTACSNSGNTQQTAPPLPSLPPISLAPFGPADLTPVADTARLTGGYDGEGCGPVTPEQVRDLIGVPGVVEFAVMAGTTVGGVPATVTSCLYAAIASSIGLSLPSEAQPAADATYAAQVSQALVTCPGRVTRQLTVLGLPGTLISCAAQNSRVLALEGRTFAPGVMSSATCAVLNAEQVDENRFLSFCADALRRAATP